MVKAKNFAKVTEWLKANKLCLNIQKSQNG